MDSRFLQEMIQQQKKKMLQVAKRLLPHVVEDDLLQPQDYLELETDPEFRYEEGVLAGLETVLAAMSALERDPSQP